MSGAAEDPNPLLERIQVSPAVCGGMACIKGTRIDVSTILDSLADGMTPEEIVDHLPQLTREDIRAAIAYASELAREQVWRVAG
jgi:uncharacterized protein (DUF433 family)